MKTPQLIPKRHATKRLVALGVSTAVGVALLVFFIVLPSYLPALAPKTGRIIDHDSGQGIADADVVVSGWYSQRGAWRDIDFCTYVAITKTDKEGYYHLPSEYSHVVVSTPSSNPENIWYLYASKDGYVTAGTKWPLEYDIDGGVKGVSRWDSRSHSNTRAGSAIAITPIELMQVHMTLQQRIAYFRETGLSTYCSDDNSYLAPMRQAVHEFYQSVLNEICSSAENDTIPSTSVNYLMLYADEVQDYIAAWRKLDPQQNHHQMTANAVSYKLSDVCNVARAGFRGVNSVRH